MSSRSFTHHADARFRIHIQHTHWGGRTYISATVYLQDWGLFLSRYTHQCQPRLSCRRQRHSQVQRPK
jgi:hypothetical protein